MTFPTEWKNEIHVSNYQPDHVVSLDWACKPINYDWYGPEMHALMLALVDDTNLPICSSQLFAFVRHLRALIFPDYSLKNMAMAHPPLINHIEVLYFVHFSRLDSQKVVCLSYVYRFEISSKTPDYV